MLKGSKVLLRPVERSDIPYFLKWLNDPEVIQYLNIYLPLTEMAEERFIEELATTRAQTDVMFVIEENKHDSTKPIGSCGLANISSKNQKAVLGIAIGEKDYWDKGYGTEAICLLIDYGFKQLNLNKISSGAFAFNERSIKMHKRVGFKEEGRLREDVFKNGQFQDHIMFGILRAEWNEQRLYP